MSDLIFNIQNNILKNIENAMPRVGIRNPMIGKGADDFRYDYPDDYFWTDSFFTGELWLAYMLTGKDIFSPFQLLQILSLQDLKKPTSLL